MRRRAEAAERHVHRRPRSAHREEVTRVLDVGSRGGAMAVTQPAGKKTAQQQHHGAVSGPPESDRPLCAWPGEFVPPMKAAEHAPSRLPLWPVSSPRSVSVSAIVIAKLVACRGRDRPNPALWAQGVHVLTLCHPVERCAGLDSVSVARKLSEYQSETSLPQAAGPTGCRPLAPLGSPPRPSTRAGG